MDRKLHLTSRSESRNLVILLSMAMPEIQKKIQRLPEGKQCQIWYDMIWYDVCIVFKHSLWLYNVAISPFLIGYHHKSSINACFFRSKLLNHQGVHVPYISTQSVRGPRRSICWSVRRSKVSTKLLPRFGGYQWEKLTERRGQFTMNVDHFPTGKPWFFFPASIKKRLPSGVETWNRKNWGSTWLQPAWIMVDAACLLSKWIYQFLEPGRWSWLDPWFGNIWIYLIPSLDTLQ